MPLGGTATVPRNSTATVTFRGNSMARSTAALVSRRRWPAGTAVHTPERGTAAVVVAVADTDTGTGTGTPLDTQLRDTDRLGTDIRSRPLGRLIWARSLELLRFPACLSGCPSSSLRLYKVLKNNPK